eukprot:6186523-Pleurochrysis_carterae.AAC.2
MQGRSRCTHTGAQSPLESSSASTTEVSGSVIPGLLVPMFENFNVNEKVELDIGPKSRPCSCIMQG